MNNSHTPTRNKKGNKKSNSIGRNETQLFKQVSNYYIRIICGNVQFLSKDQIVSVSDK